MTSHLFKRMPLFSILSIFYVLKSVFSMWFHYMCIFVATLLSLVNTFLLAAVFAVASTTWVAILPYILYLIDFYVFYLAFVHVALSTCVHLLSYRYLYNIKLLISHSVGIIHSHFLECLICLQLSQVTKFIHVISPLPKQGIGWVSRSANVQWHCIVAPDYYWHKVGFNVLSFALCYYVALFRLMCAQVTIFGSLYSQIQ